MNKHTYLKTSRFPIPGLILLLALLATQFSFARDIRIQGRENGIWNTISDNDLVPNQAVTDFGSVFGNESADRLYRIQNHGNSTLTVSVNGNSPSSTSSQFTFPGFPSSNFLVAANSDREFTIRYTPVQSSRTATIRIDSNDPDAEAVYTFAVTGEGRMGEPSVAYDPSTGNDVGIADGDTTPSASEGTDFGTLPVGSTRTRSFYIRNSSGAEDVLRIRNPRITGSGASSFQIIGLGTSNLGAGNNRDFQIRFNPTSAGTKDATFVFENNDENEGGGEPYEATYTFALRGVGTAFPEISVEGRRDQLGTTFDPITDGQSGPNSEDGTLFNDTSVGSDRDSTIRITNSGNANLTIGSRTITGTGAANFVTAGFPTNATIAPGATRDFTIRFRPVSGGTHNATISFVTNDSNENPFNFNIRGTGLAPEIRLSGRPDVGSGGYDNIIDGETTVRTSEGTDFGSVRVAGGTNVNQFKITNDGNQSLNISNPRITGPGASHFSFTGVNSAFDIGAGNDREFTITFNPSSLGTKDATFLIDSNDDDEATYSFALRGVGTGFPEIRVQGRRNVTGTFLSEIGDGDSSPRSADGTLFANTTVGESDEMLVRVSNDGDNVLNLGNRSFTGTGSSEFGTVGFPSNSNVSPGESVDFRIRFSPTSFGTKTATFSFATNDSNENPFNFVIQGLAEAPEIQAAGQLPGQSFLDIADGDTSPREADGTDFGNANVTGAGNEAQRQFRLTNSGNVPLNIENATTITGPAAADYDISGLFAGNPFVNIQPRESQTFTITFNPSNTGVRNATISIANNDPDEDPYTFALTGVGIGNPEIRVQGRRNVVGTFLTEITDGDTSPRSNDGTLFADTAVGADREMLVRIRNEGDGALEIGSRTFSGTHANQFNTVGFPTDTSILPGQDLEFRIRFAPTSFGTKNAVISFGTNDGNENPFNFSLQGLAEAPEIQVAGRLPGESFLNINDGDSSPREADGTDFGNANVTGAGNEAQREFRITNSGNIPLNIQNDTRFTGPAAADYDVSGLFAGNPFVNIQPGESQTFTITFDPSAEGVRNAVFSIANNDPDEDPYTFALTGVGIAAPEIRVQGRRNVIGTFLTEIADGDTTPRSNDGTLFADTDVGDNREMLVRISNTGDGDLNLGTRSFSGADANQFATVGFPSNETIPAGENREFRIRFTPTSFGTKTATFSFVNNDANEAPFNFRISGLAEAPDLDVFGGPNIDILIQDDDTSPSPLDFTDFGEANPSNEIITRSFRLSNLGNVPLEFSSASITNPANFSLGDLPNQGSDIPTGNLNGHEFTISFNPASAGTKTATVTIRTNDPDEDPYTFQVSGGGTTNTPDPDLEIRGGNNFSQVISAGDSSPINIDGTDFGTVLQGSAPVSRTFQMRNVGGSNLLNVQGASGNPDASVTGVNNSLAPGTNDTFTVTFTPNTPGIQTAIIGILSNDPNEAPYLFTVQLEVTSTDETPPSFTNFDLTPTGGTATFETEAGRIYKLTTSTTLQGTWIQVPGSDTVTGDGNPASITFTPDPSADPRRFYRLEKE